MVLTLLDPTPSHLRSMTWWPRVNMIHGHLEHIIIAHADNWPHFLKHRSLCPGIWSSVKKRAHVYYIAKSFSFISGPRGLYIFRISLGKMFLWEIWAVNWKIIELCIVEIRKSEMTTKYITLCLDLSFLCQRPNSISSLGRTLITIVWIVWITTLDKEAHL